jgi:hypothetical protein
MPPSTNKVAPGNDRELIEPVLIKLQTRTPTVIVDKRHRGFRPRAFSCWSRQHSRSDLVMAVTENIGLNGERNADHVLGRKAAAVDLGTYRLNRNPPLGLLLEAVDMPIIATQRI